MSDTHWHSGLTPCLMSLFSSSVICPRVGSVLTGLHIIFPLIGFIPLSFLMLWIFPPQLWGSPVTNSVFCGVDGRPRCSQCEFHFCYSFIFDLFLFLSSARCFLSFCYPDSFVSFLGRLNCVIYNFHGFWNHSVSRTYLVVLGFFPSFSLGCFALLLLHKYHDGFFRLIICLCLGPVLGAQEQCGEILLDSSQARSVCMVTLALKLYS